MIGKLRVISLFDRMIEFADHLHEHMLSPVVIKGGRYMAPQVILAHLLASFCDNKNCITTIKLSRSLYITCNHILFC